MIKKTAFVLVGFSLLASPFVVSANSSTDLQGQIQSLLAQIKVLQKQIADLSSPSRVCPQILRTLSQGSKGDDVLSLQSYLGISQTGYFGPLTARAVAKFQAEEGLSQVGFVGPQTRAAFARRCGNPNPQSGSFSAVPMKGTAPLRVDFTFAPMDHRIGGGYTIQFGDGKEQMMKEQQIYCIKVPCVPPMVADHTYASAGVYTAKLFWIPPNVGVCPPRESGSCISTTTIPTATVTVTVTDSSTDEFGKSFTDAGCTATKYGDDPPVHNCDNAPSVRAFGCRASGEILGKEYGIPMMQCVTTPPERVANTDYFSCGGGLLWTCTSYIGYVNNSFQLIKNAPALMSLVGSIQNEAQALRYVLMTKDYTSESLTLSGGTILAKVPTIRSADRFLVTVYRPDKVFGCFSEKTYYKVVFEVTPSGVVYEENSTVAHKETMPGVLCVD